MYWTEEQEQEHIGEKREKILIKCKNMGCDGVYTLLRYPDDFSPRVHSDCYKCDGFMSVKLSSIEDDRIISREWV